MEVKQLLHNASESCFFTCYALFLHTMSNESVRNLEHCDVADISTGEYYLEMVAGCLHPAKLVITDIDKMSFLMDPSNSPPMLSPPPNQDIQCVESIELSSFNPPPRYRRLSGDLVYLDVVELAGSKHCITRTEKGFYVNTTTGKVLDPRPRKSVSETTLHSLRI